MQAPPHRGFGPRTVGGSRLRVVFPEAGGIAIGLWRKNGHRAIELGNYRDTYGEFGVRTEPNAVGRVISGDYANSR